MMLKYLIQTSIFRYSKNYGSLTHETRIKDAVNMADIICLLATVRTLKRGNIGISSRSNGTHPIKLSSIIRQPCSHPGGYSTLILIEVCGPKGRNWGLKERIGTKNRGLKN